MQQGQTLRICAFLPGWSRLQLQIVRAQFASLAVLSDQAAKVAALDWNSKQR